MNLPLIRASVIANARFEFSRSGGPGGQHVNTSSTKACARVELAKVEGLSDAERARVAERCASRLDAEGYLYVVAAEERSQAVNRERALERLVSIIEKAAWRPKPRIPTKATRASRERRLESKRARGETKRARRGGDFAE
jgi:ribosome-associated protein